MYRYTIFVTACLITSLLLFKGSNNGRKTSPLCLILCFTAYVCVCVCDTTNGYFMRQLKPLEQVEPWPTNLVRKCTFDSSSLPSTPFYWCIAIVISILVLVRMFWLTLLLSICFMKKSNRKTSCPQNRCLWES